MLPLLALLLPALIPVATDAAKGIFGGLSRLIVGETGTKPQNVDEYVKMQESDVKRLQALAALDTPAANISPWVADLRASFRYIAAGIIVVAGTFVMVFDAVSPVTVSAESYNVVTQMMGSVFSFMFGDRLYLSLKKNS